MSKLNLKDLTPEQCRRIKTAISKTWSNISADAPPRMRKQEIIEMVLDADYVEIYGGDNEAVRSLRRLSDADQDSLAAEIL